MARQGCAPTLWIASLNPGVTGGDSWAVTVLTLTMTPKDGGETFSQTVCEAGSFEDGLLKALRIHYFDAAEVAAKAG